MAAAAEDVNLEGKVLHPDAVPSKSSTSSSLPSENTKIQSCAASSRLLASVALSAELALRAGFLAAVFAPFFTVGVPLLLASSWLPSSGAAPVLWPRRLAWHTLLFGCRRAGAATIKASGLNQP
jgi:hypothetical protein